MSVTYGFYNSLNGDRRYDANQMSAIFDGLIIDGVFASIGTAFVVQANEGLSINVGIGKAWFNHTWTVNDSIMPMTAPESEVLLDRIDAIILDIDGTENVRANSIMFIKGTASSNPIRPTMISQQTHHQYPLCYIYRAAGSNEIVQADITNAIGTNETPFVTGILQTMSGGVPAHASTHAAGGADALTPAAIGAASAVEAYSKPLRFFNTSVTTASWTSNATYPDFPYRKSVALTGVLANMVPDVVFAPDTVLEGNLAPVTAAYAGGIYLYAASVPAAAFTIPTITCWKVV